MAKLFIPVLLTLLSLSSVHAQNIDTSAASSPETLVNCKCENTECRTNANQEAFEFLSTFYSNYISLYLANESDKDARMQLMREVYCTPSLLQQIGMIRKSMMDDEDCIKQGMGGEAFDPIIAGCDFNTYCFDSIDIKPDEDAPATFTISYNYSEELKKNLKVKLRQENDGYKLHQIIAMGTLPANTEGEE